MWCSLTSRVDHLPPAGLQHPTWNSAYRKSVGACVYRKGPPKRGKILFTSDALCRWKDHGVSSTQGYPARNLYLDAIGGLGGHFIEKGVTGTRSQL